MLSRTVIRAPFAGQVLKRHLDVGGNVSDGTAVYDLADLDPLYADVGVPERQISTLGVGQPVRMVADSTGDAVAGSIERLAPEVDATTGTVKVTVAVPGGSGLRPGGFVRVDIVIDTHEQALVVPRSALVAEGRRWHLFRVLEDGTSRRALEVERGYEEGDLVEILSVVSSHEPSVRATTVIVVGAAALTDGSAIRSSTTKRRPPSRPSLSRGPVTLPDFSVRRRVTVAMVTLAVAVFGAISFWNLPIELLPDLAYPTLTIQTEYTDAAPSSVEQFVTRPRRGGGRRDAGRSRDALRLPGRALER